MLQRLLWQLGTGQADYCSQSTPKKEKHKIIRIYTKCNQLLKMMVTINNNYSYIVVAIILSLRSLFDIHSSIVSIILCSTFIRLQLHWNTTQYFEYAPYNEITIPYILCQHFLKTSSPCLPLQIHTKQKVLLISICDFINNVAMQLHERPAPKPTQYSLKRTHYKLNLILMLGKGKCGWLLRDRHF